MVTLILFSMIAGMAAVTYKGERMIVNRDSNTAYKYECAWAMDETSGNILSFFFPEEKAAAQFVLILCAALSEIL